MAARPSPTVLLYAAVALSLLFLLGTLPNLREDGSPRSHRRLKLRTDFSEAAPARLAVRFDPIVADIEMRREDREWESTHHGDGRAAAMGAEEWGGYRDAEDYVNDAKRFNVSRRIEELFPMIDEDPRDGVVTLAELKTWFVRQAVKDKEHRTAREMELVDKNRDGFVSFDELEKFSSTLHYDANESSLYSGWFSQEHFQASDLDEDGRLNLTEFTDFSDPADSTNPKLINWLCKQEIRQRDKDGDGKLNLTEFYPGVVEFFTIFYPNVSLDIAMTTSTREMFTGLDLDKDKALNEKELEPVIGILHPSELSFADRQSDQAFSQADADKDGRLTLKEMVESAYAFYPAVASDDVDNSFHEEFR